MVHVQETQRTQAHTKMRGSWPQGRREKGHEGSQISRSTPSAPGHRSDRTNRKPRYELRIAGKLPSRRARRALRRLPFQEPPRTTRRAPSGRLRSPTSMGCTLRPSSVGGPPRREWGSSLPSGPLGPPPPAPPRAEDRLPLLAQRCPDPGARGRFASLRGALSSIIFINFP